MHACEYVYVQILHLHIYIYAHVLFYIYIYIYIYIYTYDVGKFWRVPFQVGQQLLGRPYFDTYPSGEKPRCSSRSDRVLHAGPSMAQAKSALKNLRVGCVLRAPFSPWLTENQRQNYNCPDPAVWTHAQMQRTLARTS